MSWSQIRELAQMGFEIGNHTHSHPAMSQLGNKSKRRSVTSKINVKNMGLRILLRSPIPDIAPARKGSKFYEHGDIDMHGMGTTNPTFMAKAIR